MLNWASRRRERRAAESSEARETQLAKHREADRATYMLQIQTGEQSVVESVAAESCEQGRHD